MPAANYELICEKGTTFTKRLVWKTQFLTPIDITGFTARLSVQRYFTDTQFLLELSSPTNGIVITGNTGTIDITISPTQTAELPSGNWKYDLIVVSPTGTTTRLLEGIFTVKENVTA